MVWRVAVRARGLKGRHLCYDIPNLHWHCVTKVEKHYKRTCLIYSVLAVGSQQHQTTLFAR